MTHPAEEYREGLAACRAFYAGDPWRPDGPDERPANPHLTGSPEAQAWSQGWNTHWHPAWSAKEVS